MTTIRIICLVVITFCVICDGIFLYLKHAAETDLTCAIIHKPSSGCPGGYVQEKRPRFTERDGSKEFACISRDPSKEPCTDVLKPGESMGLFFQIPVPEPDEPPKSKI
jgi:hypothetical protein